MKNLIFIFLSFVLATSVSAQLKVIPESNSPVSSETVIDVPSFKKIGAQQVNKNKKFAPKSMRYIPTAQNGLTVKNRAENQLPILITGSPELQMRSTDTPDGMAMNFLDNAKELMQIGDPIHEFINVKTETDELGMTHVKYQQVYKGIPVYGSEVIYHYDDKSQFLNGRYQATPTIENVTPSLDASMVETIAIKDVGGITKAVNDKFDLFDFDKVKSRLIIYDNTLCYELTVYKNIIDRWQYIVDAHTGDIIHQYQNMCKFHNHTDDQPCTHNHQHENHASSDVAPARVSATLPPPNGPFVSTAQDLFGSTRQINTYEVNNQFFLIDASRTMFDSQNSSIPNDPVGTVWTIDAFDTNPQNSDFKYDHVVSNSSNFSGKQTGVSAQYNGGQAYQYFKNRHNRESINGSGGNVIGLINISDEDGSSLGNAFWNGIAMFYGNGDNSFFSLARGLDVAGHEMSHGVVQSTANLEYRGESGALNESFADIFGAMIDRDDWLIGEDVVKSSSFPSGALRSLQDPHNGASTGNFNAGWQPRIYSERFTGSQDNGGVHINSGIPNWAFFKFATSSGVGKERAEEVYYRALDKYLTKSSQFIDARIAVVQAATDLYGASVANAARAAFDAVEIFDGSGTVVTTDVEVNPGEDLVIFTTENQDDLFIATAGGDLLFNPLTTQDPLSVPSVSDDGSEILFVNQDKELYYIRIDWDTQSIVEEGIIGSNELWRNAVFSKDGLRMAALRDATEDRIFVFDFVTGNGQYYTLFNPTFTEGINTGDVLYADALEFDFTGDFLMYDAFNRIESTFGNPIDYWDIGFIKVFNSDAGTFASGDDIQKLFSQLPEGVDIGNPTFSKNSDYIISFDFLEDNEFKVLGSNIEAQDTRTIFENNDRPGYPSYSNNDDRLLFDAVNDGNGLGVIGAATLLDNKIESNSAAIQLGFNSTGIKWGVWFGNGERDITDVEDVILSEDAVVLSPNPTDGLITLTSNIDDAGITNIAITDMMGRVLMSTTYPILSSDLSIDVTYLPTGQYVLSLKSEKGISSELFIKQ